MTDTTHSTSLLETARLRCSQIRADHAALDAGRRVPEALARDLAAAGFFRIFLPAAYGGLDMSPLEGLAVFEELARADASVAWCVWNGNAYWTAPLLSGATTREIFSDPMVIVANSTQPRGRASLAADGYRVSGRWSLVSGCQLADWLHLACILYQDGTPLLLPSGAPRVQFLFCCAADCQILDTWSAGGLRGTGSHDVVVEDVFVPAHHASWFLDPPVLPEPRYRMPSWSREIPGAGAIALGIARGAMEALVELAGSKRPERSAHLLTDDPAAQARLAQAEGLMRSARLFLFEAVRELWEAVLAGEETSATLRAAVRLATNHAVTSAVQAVDLLYLTGGATSLYTGNPLERAFRDVHAITQHVAVHARVLENVGRVLVGREPDSPVF